jgi:hypothetical protein
MLATEGTEITEILEKKEHKDVKAENEKDRTFIGAGRSAVLTGRRLCAFFKS